MATDPSLGTLSSFDVGASSALTSTPDVSETPTRAVIIGREYRPWIEYPSGQSATSRPISDFLITSTPAAANALSPLPIGSLARTRFYYGALGFVTDPHAFTASDDTSAFTSTNHGFHDGDAVELSDLVDVAPFDITTTYYVIRVDANTFQLSLTEETPTPITVTNSGSGNIARLPFPFRPLWLYPVSVALAATPWWRWGAGNRVRHGDVTTADARPYGWINDPTLPHEVWSPGIGLAGEGTSIIAMQMNQSTFLDLPFPTALNQWFFHYSERHNVPQNDLITDIADGPINPYLILPHQGRIIMPDRRRSAPHIATSGVDLDYGSVDDLVWYSDYALPTQDFLPIPLATDRGKTNVTYGPFPVTTQTPYYPMLVAEDQPSIFGVIGVVTIDQLLLIKHAGGGALVSGDLDNPTHQRLPHIESTGGLIHKGTHTPIGFCYGSPNGIFVWQGGNESTRISPQLDGFFWDHTDGTPAESYAGARGRFAYWDGYILAPNNYIFDIEAQSWWRLKVASLAPIRAQTAPYNCYDTGQDEIRRTLYAFPYRHVAIPSTGGWIEVGEGDEVEIELEAPVDFLDYDFRICVSHLADAVDIEPEFWLMQALDGATLRFGLSRAWVSSISQYALVMELPGGAEVASTSLTPFFATNDPLCLRITYSSGAYSLQYKVPSSDIALSMADTSGWTTATSSALTPPSSADFDSIHIGAPINTLPFNGRILAFHAEALGVEISTMTPSDVPFASPVVPQSLSVSVGPDFVGTFGMRVHPGVGLPAWYTYDSDDLDDEYTWQSHPLVETRDRLYSVQDIELTATSSSPATTRPTITITLNGFDQAGAPVPPVTTTFTLANSPDPQLLRKDVMPNFNAAYITVSIHAQDYEGYPAPKIQRIAVGRRDRSKIRRQG